MKEERRRMRLFDAAVHVLRAWSIGRRARFCGSGGLRLLAARCEFAMVWCCMLMLGRCGRDLVSVSIIGDDA